MSEKVEALRRTALFGELDDVPMRALADRAVEKRLARGAVLFNAGERAAGLYVVVSGSLRAFRMSLDGREQVIHVEREGATIAEVPVFDGGPTPSTVAADTDAVVLFIDTHDVRRLCADHPAISMAALKVLAGRLRRCSDLVATISLDDVGQRLARFLLTEALSTGEPSGAAITFTFALTKEQIATRIGSVREVVSRAHSRLQQDGLIAVNGTRVTIPNVAALRAFIGE